MTSEEINILLKDLCARSPYGVKFHYYSEFADGEDPEFDNTITVVDTADWQILDEDHKDFIPIRKILPYLRPMSSMTDEEKSYVQQCIDIVEAENYGDSYSPAAWDAMSDFTNYCYERHLDLHGLIPKGLALNAPEGMYEIK